MYDQMAAQRHARAASAPKAVKPLVSLGGQYGQLSEWKRVMGRKPGEPVPIGMSVEIGRCRVELAVGESYHVKDPGKLAAQIARDLLKLSKPARPRKRSAFGAGSLPTRASDPRWQCDAYEHAMGRCLPDCKSCASEAWHAEHRGDAVAVNLHAYDRQPERRAA